MEIMGEKMNRGAGHGVEAPCGCVSLVWPHRVH